MLFEKKRKEVEPGKYYEIIYPLHEVESFNGHELNEYISEICNDVSFIIISFANIAYINSSGLRELIQILKTVRKSGKELYLIQLPGDIKKIFVRTNLDRLFCFKDSVADVFADGDC